MTVSAHVVWHDVECGHYAADLVLWRQLAREAAGPVLDVGAGTGRVALRLAEDGLDVTALDRDAELLAVLEQRARAAGVEVETVRADAADFALPARFALIAVPMQTLQLLPGQDARGGFFASARRALVPGGLVAAAIADELEPFEEQSALPAPDVGEAGGLRYLSQPVAVRERPGAVRIERIRQVVAPDGSRTSEDDVIELRSLDAERLAAEAEPHGLRPEPPLEIPPTHEHVGSTVVMLRG
ncbi:MAG TPA: class I SAM-dependent methyltransferase [Solirubrobacteraceae bacterium]|nr:class I SAM-dependent methyltransferase [Solirubrobacteraceae bacterium]